MVRVNAHHRPAHRWFEGRLPRLARADDVYDARGPGVAEVLDHRHPDPVRVEVDAEGPGWLGDQVAEPARVDGRGFSVPHGPPGATYFAPRLRPRASCRFVLPA